VATVEAGFTAVVFMVAEAFTAGEAFMEGVVSEPFAEAILGTFMAGVSGDFTVMVVFSARVSMGIRGGTGVIPIIGVIRITLITRTTGITPTSQSGCRSCLRALEMSYFRTRAPTRGAFRG